MASYLLPLLISLSTNLTQSSTIYLTFEPSSLDSATLVFALSHMDLAASVWQTQAPAAKQASSAAVYKQVQNFNLCARFLWYS